MCVIPSYERNTLPTRNITKMHPFKRLQWSLLGDIKTGPFGIARLFQKGPVFLGVFSHASMNGRLLKPPDFIVLTQQSPCQKSYQEFRDRECDPDTCHSPKPGQEER